jgi:hypothetical protein
MRNIEDCERGYEFSDRGGNTVCFDFFYPRQSPTQHIEIGIFDVRASDGIRIHYDYDRDGYVIEQPTQLAWSSDEPTDYKWKEVAFIKS